MVPTPQESLNVDFGRLHSSWPLNCADPAGGLYMALVARTRTQRSWSARSAKTEAVVSALHVLRIVTSYALLGAVLAGASLGWFHNLPFDPRSIGAVIGVIAGLAIVIRHYSNEAGLDRA